MGCETIDETIGDVTYMTTQWPATKQMIMKLKIAQTFGPSIFKMVGALSTKGGKAEKAKVQMDAAEEALATLFNTSSPEKIVGLIQEILVSSNTKRDGTRLTPNNLDTVYNDAGMMEMYKAALFVIKVNFADFFKGQKAGEILAKVEEKL